MNNPLWCAEHTGRISSSICHKVYKRRSSTKPDKLVASILEGFSNANKLKATDPRAHGHQMEDSARKTYVDPQMAVRLERFLCRSMGFLSIQAFHFLLPACMTQTVERVRARVFWKSSVLHANCPSKTSARTEKTFS